MTGLAVPPQSAALQVPGPSSATQKQSAGDVQGRENYTPKYLMCMMAGNPGRRHYESNSYFILLPDPRIFPQHTHPASYSRRKDRGAFQQRGLKGPLLVATPSFSRLSDSRPPTPPGLSGYPQPSPCHWPLPTQKHLCLSR